MDTPHPLGRVERQDARSLAYPARAADTLRTVTWRRYGPTLDQLETSSCTGHAAAHAINSLPVHKYGARVLTHTDALTLYSEATKLDPFPWTYPPQDDGSSVLAIGKAAKQAGHATAYTWCFGLDHTLRALTLGPVILGTPWYEHMFTPDRTGRVSIDGANAGGHAYLAVGLNTRTRTVTCQNSWGKQWGINGRFTLTWDQLATLLAQRGDALTLQP